MPKLIQVVIPVPTLIQPVMDFNTPKGPEEMEQKLIIKRHFSSYLVQFRCKKYFLESLMEMSNSLSQHQAFFIERHTLSYTFLFILYNFVVKHRGKPYKEAFLRAFNVNEPSS